MNTTDDINIKQLLYSKYSLLGRMCSRATKLNTINTILKNFLLSIDQNPQNQSSLSNSTQLVNIKKNIITIETARAEYLTLLKMHNDSLLSHFRQVPQLANIIRIQYKVNPELLANTELTAQHYAKSRQMAQQAEHTKKPNQINQKAKQQLSETINKIDNPKLKRLLAKIFK